MSRFTTRLVTLLVTFSLLICAMPTGAAPRVPIDVQDSGYEEEISILLQLGIIEEPADGLMNIEGVLSRGEFYKMLSKITKKADNINSQADIKSKEAMEKVIDLLGYGPIAKKRGYVKIATQLKLLPKGEILTKKEAVLLIYKALETKMFETVGYGDTVTYSNRNSDTLLYKYLGMKKIEGRVDGNEKSAISPYSPTGEGSVLIDGVRYNAKDTGIEREIGRTVIAYVGDTGSFPEDVYAYCYKYSDSDDITINGADIVKNKTGIGEIYYESTSGSIRKKTFSDDAVIVYNGEVIDSYSDKTFRIESGTIILASSKDSKADVVYINEYTTHIAEGANSHAFKVFFKNGEKPLVIDEDRCDLDVYVDGARGSLDDISEFDAVDVYKSKSGDSVILDVTKARVVGIYESSDEKRIYIDSKEYILKADAPGIENCVLGEKYTFIVNSENVVCGVDTLNVSSGEYGYLFKVSGDTDMPEEGILIKLFTVNNEFTGFRITDDIKIDGVWFEPDEFWSEKNPLLNNNIAVRQVVMYKKDASGVLCEINTAKDNTQFQNPDAVLRLDEKRTNANTRMYRRTFGINYRFTGSTKVFILPTAGNENDENNYKCTTVDEWGEDHRFTNYEIYNTPRSRDIGLFITYEQVKEEGYSENKQRSNVVLVEKNLRTIDEDNTPCYKLTYYEAGSQKTAYFEDDEVCNAYPDAWSMFPKTMTAADIKPGDIMQLVLDVKGRITEFHMLERLSSYDKEFKEILPSGYAYTADSVPLSYLYTAYGEVVDTYGGTVTVDVNNTNDADNKAYHRNFKIEGSTSCMLYDNGVISKISGGDVMLGDMVFVRAYNYIPYNIIVVR